MKLPRPLRSVSVLLLSIAVLLAILTYLGMRTYGELERQRAGPTDSAQWSIFQTSLEFNKLNNAYSQYRIEASQQNVDELRKRFDIFYSRVNTLKTSKAFDPFRGMRFFVESTLIFNGFLSRIATLIDREDFGTLRSDPAIEREFTEVERSVTSFVTSAIQTEAAWDEETRNQLKRLLLMQLVTFGLAVLSFFYFAIVVLQQRNEAMRREDDLRKNRDLLRTTIKSSLDGVLIADAKGRVVDINDAAAEMFGYEASEMTGQEMSGLIIPQRLRAGHVAGMERFAATGKAKVIGRRIELDALRRDGTEFPVEISIFSTGSGAAAQYVGFLRDITERRMDEQSLKAARDRAEAANRAKAQFLAAISHEMRTPLTGILGALDLLATTDLTERQRKYIQTADRSGHALLSVISDVLDISRLESGKVDLELEALDIGLIVDDVVEIVGKLAEERGNMIGVRLDDRLPGGLTGDAARIRQVLLNLATNAVKFTYDGAITISVTPLSLFADRAEVEFAVEDTGPGIAEADKDKLFRNFSQLRNGSDNQAGGTGLGLAISSRLVEIMSGMIGVESVLGKGSRFWFRLPLVIDAEQALTNSGSAAILPSVPSSPPMAVLVVDDNETVRSIIAGQLSSKGHGAETADSAMTALSMLKATSYDAVILDISMPVMDGFEALRIIRGLPGAAGRTPVIALTAHALIEDRERCIAAGFDKFLTKPVRADELALAIAEVTSAQSAGLVVAPAKAADAGSQVPLFELGELREQFVSVAPADLRRIVERYGLELDQQLALLTGEGSEISPHHLRRIVHKLSGSSAMIGAKRLSGLANSLDALLSSQEDAELSSSIEDLVGTIRETRTAVQQASRDLDLESV